MERRVTWRWGAPAVSVGVVVAVAAAPHAMAASAHPVLPARSAASLLAAVESSDVQAMSGTVRTVARLGLPQLPDRMASGGVTGGWTGLLTGSHQLRVWIDGADRQRVALLGDLTETDVIHEGNQVWTWSSDTQAVTQQTLHSSGAAGHTETAPDAAAQLTPQAQADKALHAVDPTTIVTVDRTARVAGRPAYQLVLTPRTNATLIRSVRIAIDAARSVPLRVQVFAAGSGKPAFETGFTSVSFRRPAASVFQFTPPTGSHPAAATDAGGSDPATTSSKSDRSKPVTLGSGWASVLELPAGTVDLSGRPARDGRGPGMSGAGVLREVTTPVPQGRLLVTRLLTALITNDGRVFLGAVPAATLERAAGA